jgi:hypothetical protein
MTTEQIQALVAKNEARRAARDLKKAARLGVSAAQRDAAEFRENARLERLRDRTPLSVQIAPI